MLDRKTAPAIHDAIEFDYVLPAINEVKLSNGIPLYWLNAGVQDVVEVDWIFPAGLWQEQKPAVAHAVSGLLKNGTSKRAAKEIHESLEFYGASLKVYAGNDYGAVTLYTLTKHLRALLPIVHEILTDAIFPEAELAIHKQNAIQRLMVNKRQCEFVANQHIDALIFGPEHPYGRYSRQENIEALTREDMLLFYKNAYALSGMKMLMGGAIGEKEVGYVDEIFGNALVTSSAADAQNFVMQPAAELKHRIINDPKGVQGAIRIGNQFPNRHHPDFAPAVVLNTLFGGYFGSRLMSNIREEKGYTYGIYSSLSPYSKAGSFIVHTEVGRDVVEPAVTEIYREMEILCNEEADEEELLLVKNYLLGNLLGDLDGPFSILQRWKTLILNGMNAEHFNRNINIYKTITAPEIKALAQKYYTGDFYEVVVI